QILCCTTTSRAGAQQRSRSPFWPGRNRHIPENEEQRSTSLPPGYKLSGELEMKKRGIVGAVLGLICVGGLIAWRVYGQEQAPQQAEANLARDQAQLTNAQTNLGRYAPLMKQGFASEQQVTDQTSSVTQLQAAVLGDKAAIFNAQTQLSYTTITAPIDGVTGI